MTPSVTVASVEGEQVAHREMVDRFVVEFPTLDRRSIERCLSDTWRCARHLCSTTSLNAVELMTHERLMGRAASARSHAASVRPRPAGDGTLSDPSNSSYGGIK
jgi:hypothetical protein